MAHNNIAADFIIFYGRFYFNLYLHFYLFLFVGFCFLQLAFAQCISSYGYSTIFCARPFGLILELHCGQLFKESQATGKNKGGDGRHITVMIVSAIMNWLTYGVVFGHAWKLVCRLNYFYFFLFCICWSRIPVNYLTREAKSTSTIIHL